MRHPLEMPVPIVPMRVFQPRQQGYFGDVPQSTVTPFRGPKDTLDLMARQALGPRGEQSMAVRKFTEWVVQYVQPKDYLGEILAIRNIFVQWSPWKQGVPLFRYTNDPRHQEFLRDPQAMVEAIAKEGSCLCDCDETAQMGATMAMQVGREVELVALGFAPGSLSHVGVRVREPKSQEWIWLDGVAGPREREAASRAKELLVLSLN